MTIKFVMRKDIQSRLMQKWAEAIKLAREVGLPVRIPDWDQLHNYEMESLMREHFGGEAWVVGEWCPFDWIHCMYFHGASKHDLKEARETIAAWPDLDRTCLYIRFADELGKRPSGLGEHQKWGEGIVKHLEEKGVA